MAKLIVKACALSVAGLLTAGCVVYEQPRPVAVVEQPVVVGPGVEVIEVEPAPADRVYVYEEGYPPGVYFCNGFYWYNGYRYQHDVFVDRVVTVNIRENRYIDVEENRRAGQQIEIQHRQEYAVNHGQRPGGPVAAANRTQPRDAQRTAERTGAHPAARPELEKRNKQGAQASVRE